MLQCNLANMHVIHTQPDSHLLPLLSAVERLFNPTPLSVAEASWFGRLGMQLG